MEDKVVEVNRFYAHTLFIEAARYAFGRATYASSLTAEIVKQHIDQLAPNTCCVIARDIRKNLDVYYMGQEGKPPVDPWYDCDIKPWEDLLPALDKRAEEND